MRYCLQWVASPASRLSAARRRSRWLPGGAAAPSANEALSMCPVLDAQQIKLAQRSMLHELGASGAPQQQQSRLAWPRLYRLCARHEALDLSHGFALDHESALSIAVLVLRHPEHPGEPVVLLLAGFLLGRVMIGRLRCMCNMACGDHRLTAQMHASARALLAPL